MTEASISQGLTLCWATVQGATLYELFDAAVAADCTGVTVSPAQYFSALAAGASETAIRERLDAAGLFVAAIDPMVSELPGSAGFEQLRPALRAYYEFDLDRCLEAAAVLRAPSINVLQFIVTNADVNEWGDAIRSLARRAEPAGVRLDLEFVPCTGIGNFDVAIGIARAADVTNVGITMDTWHFSRSGQSIDALARPDTRLVNFIQVSDGHEQPADTEFVPARDRLLPGEGSLPLAHIVATIREKQPQVVVGVEVLNKDLRALRPTEAAAVAAAAIRRCIPELDVRH
jgi:sugar phosphate isomerase/epimerase